ncbi:MAG: hypothetical protein HY306_09125 [Nitrosomonadales bacterium]|nr:hypothetical protein [Nitrosomonadales bacterium]
MGVPVFVLPIFAFTASKMIMKSSYYAVILCALSLANAGCEFRPDNQFIIISGPLHFAANATVVVISPELIQTPYSVNTLCFQPSISNRFPKTKNQEFGALSEDGKVFVPHVSLLDSKGVEDVLTPGPLQGASKFCYEPTWRQWNQEVHHGPYTKVVVTSPSDLNIDQITWFSGDK